MMNETYDALAAKIARSRNGNPPLANNTRCAMHGDDVVVTLHGHPIATLHADGAVTVRDCGWRTVTTKDRVNKFLPWPYRVVQRAGVWYFSDDGWSFETEHLTPWQGAVTVGRGEPRLSDARYGDWAVA